MRSTLLLLPLIDLFSLILPILRSLVTFFLGKILANPEQLGKFLNLNTDGRNEATYSVLSGIKTIGVILQILAIAKIASALVDGVSNFL